MVGPGRVELPARLSGVRSEIPEFFAGSRKAKVSLKDSPNRRVMSRPMLAGHQSAVLEQRGIGGKSCSGYNKSPLENLRHFYASINTGVWIAVAIGVYRSVCT